MQTPQLTSLQKDSTYNIIGKKDFSGYIYDKTTYQYVRGSYFTPNKNTIIVNQDINIVHLYKKQFTVTVKYIDDESGKLIDSISTKTDRDSTWPSNDTIKINT